MFNWTTYKEWLGNIRLSDVASQTPCPSPQQFVTDSRAIEKGQWFIPLKGENFDGHDFISQALSKGASGYLSEQMPIPGSSIPYIKVSNTLDAYHALAAGWRKSLPSSCKIIALTGSVGKTTVKTMLDLMLSPIAKTACTPGNHNNEFSIPKALLKVSPDHRFAIFEFGARNPGDIAFLTKTVQPDVCICLNVASAHLGVFGDRKTIMKTKLEIIEYSPNKSIAVVNHDDKTLLERAREFNHKLLSFGYHHDASVSILAVRKHDTETEILLKTQGGELTVKIDVYHESYAINICAAIAAGLALNLTPQQCQKGLSSFSGLKGRYNVHHAKDGFVIIDDAYNASPESMKAGLSSLKQSFPEKKKILVLGDMRELGSFTEEAHKSLAPYCLSIAPEILITVGQFSNMIAEEAIRIGLDQNRVRHFKNSDDLLKEISSICNKGDLLYVKGSFAIQLGRIVEHVLSVKS